MVRGSPEESRKIGIAADHAVESHDIRRIDGGRDRSKVGMSEGHPSGVTQPCRLGRGNGDVSLGRVNLGGAGKPVFEQHVVDGPDSATDVEESRAGGKGTLADRIQELSRGWVGPPPMKAAQIVDRKLVIELLIGRAAMAAGHLSQTCEAAIRAMTC